MTRPYSPADLIVLPVLSTSNTKTLGTRLVSAAKGVELGPAQASLDDLKVSIEELDQAAKTHHYLLEDERTLRAVDYDIDTVHKCQRGFFRALAEFKQPENPHASTAQRLLAFWYGKGAFYSEVNASEQWDETDKRLQVIGEQGFASLYEELGATSFLAALQRLHAEYGEAAGITVAEPQNAALIALRPYADRVRSAMRWYLFAVMALQKPGDAESEAMVRRLLLPYLEWDSQ